MHNPVVHRVCFLDLRVKAIDPPKTNTSESVDFAGVSWA